MKRLFRQPARVMVSFLFILATAHEGPAGSAAPVSATDRIQAMAEFLSKAPALTVDAEMGYDVVQSDGQKIEFGESCRVSLRRPDRMRMDIVKRDGSKGLFLFDGNEVIATDFKHNVYGSASRPGHLDAAIDYFKNDLGMRLPLSDFFKTTLPVEAKKDIRKIDHVEESIIGGVPCDHIVGRKGDLDIQIWIAKGEPPVPRRLVITYRFADGQPQFWAQFSNWNFTPDIPDSQFVFTPPEGAERVPFVAPARTEKPAPKGGKKK